MEIFVDPQGGGDAVIGNIGQIYAIGKAYINHHFWAIKDGAKPGAVEENWQFRSGCGQFWV